MIYTNLYTQISNSFSKLNVRFLIILTVTTIMILIFLRYLITKISSRNIIISKNGINIVIVTIYLGVILIINYIINHHTLYLLLERNESSGYSILFNWCLMKYNEVNKEEWLRQLIEMLSYIPLGIILTKLFKRRMSNVVGWALLISFCVEVICSRFCVSAFIWQTLLFNAIGAAVGVLIAKSFCVLFDKQCPKKRLYIYLLPILVSILYFVLSNRMYYCKEYGDIYPRYYKKLETNHFTVDKKNNVNFQKEFVPRERSEISFTSDEIRLYAEKYFSLKGRKIDYSKTRIALEEEFWGNIQKGDIVYTDKEETLMFIGKPYGFYFIDLKYYGKAYLDDPFEGIGRDFVDKTIECDDANRILSMYGINILGKACDYDNSGANIAYVSHKEIVDGKIATIKVLVDFYEDNDPGKINVMYYYTNYDYREKTDDICQDIVQPEQAYEKILCGECYAENLYEQSKNMIVNIKVTDYMLEIQRDNLNCLQYVYCFCIEPIIADDGTVIDRIYVPAMKSYYE